MRHLLSLADGQDLVTTVIALLVHGCPAPDIVAVFQLDERTVEIRVQMQNVIVWLAMAIQVSTRLWGRWKQSDGYWVETMYSKGAS